MANPTISAPAAEATTSTLESLVAGTGVSLPQSGKDFLLGVTVPTATKTYTPLSHADLIGAVMEQLDKRGLIVKDERYSWNRSGQQMFGQIVIGGLNDEQDMSIGFRNSYDKSLQAGVVAGSRVIVCSNLMFKGDFRAMAMHYGEVLKSVTEMVEKAVANLEKNYRAIQKDSKKLKSVKVDQSLIYQVLGELFYNEQLVTAGQLAIMRQELKDKTNFGDETMWDLYNHTTEALKTTPSGLIIGRHIEAHDYFMAKVGA